jgi:hypothetical protein
MMMYSAHNAEETGKPEHICRYIIEVISGRHHVEPPSKEDKEFKEINKYISEKFPMLGCADGIYSKITEHELLVKCMRNTIDMALTPAGDMTTTKGKFRDVVNDLLEEFGGHSEMPYAFKAARLAHRLEMAYAAKKIFAEAGYT